MIAISRIVETPELVDVIYEFAQGRFGADDQRMEIMQFIREEHPDRLPEDGLVPMWIQGRQTEIFLLAFEIYEEPEEPKELADDLLDKHVEAYEFLLDNQPEKAEPLLKDVISGAPDFPSAYNQLIVAYKLLDRPEEARALTEETQARFPDYLFGRIALAHLRVGDGQIEEAKELVDPILKRERLHISEFQALAQVEMDIALAEGRKDSARSWLSMWESIEDDNPELKRWRMRIEGRGTLLKALQKLAGLTGN